MDPLSTLWETFFDWESMRAALPEMLTVGLPNTLILAVSAALAESLRLGMIQRSLTAPVRRRSVLFGEALSRFIVAAARRHGCRHGLA